MARKRAPIEDRIASIRAQVAELEAIDSLPTPRRRTLTGLKAALRVMERARDEKEATGKFPAYMEVKS